MIGNIDYVKSGFHKNLFSFTGERTGDFYYYVYMKDGKKIDLSTPSPTAAEKYEKDTYLEIEEYDAFLMKHDVRKVSSEKNHQFNDLASQYKQRFMRIIKNK